VKYYLRSDIAMFKSLQSFITILIVIIPLGSNFFYISSEKKEKAWDVSVWTSLVTSVLILALLFTYRDPLENIFSLKILQLNIKVLFLIPLTSLIKSLGISKLSREMQFKQISLSLIFKQLILYGGIIFFSFHAANLRTLLLVVVFSEIVEASSLVIFCIINKLRLLPRNFFSVKLYNRGTLRYLGFIGADQIFNVMAINFPAIFVVMVMGKTLAPEFQLSQYAISIPISLVMTSVAKVIFPYIARMEDNKKIANLLFSVEFAMNLVLIPVLVGISFFAQEIINIFFEKSWVNAVFMFQVFPIMMIANIFNNPFSSLCIIKNKPHVLLIYSISLLAVRMGAIYFGFMWGGFKMAVILFIIFDIIVRIVRLNVDLSTIELNFMNFLNNIKLILIFGLVLLISTHSLNLVIKNKIIVFLIGIFLYTMLNYIFEKNRIMNSVNKILVAWNLKNETD
jgi:O-antigen/teichoic acid export membrane protein